MQNPLISLASLFQETQPEQPLDARIAKVCTKWDVAQQLADDIHAELQAMPLNNAEDLPRFHRTLNPRFFESLRQFSRTRKPT
jgi:hypothetical protein